MNEEIMKEERVPIVLYVKKSMWEGIREIAARFSMKPEQLAYKMFLVGVHRIRLTNITRIKKKTEGG